MNYKQYNTTRAVIGFLIGAIVAVAATINNFYLAISGILIGILFMFLAKSKFKDIVVDERIISISGRASRVAYTVVTMFLSLLGLFFMFGGKGQNDIYHESLGVAFCYISLLLITIYSISFHYFNIKYGADNNQ